MNKCAFLTLDERGNFVIDDEHAIEPMAALGWKVQTVSWRPTTVPWSDFEAVVIRSTWDYWNDVPGFLATLESIDACTRLANPLSLVRWNFEKTYLRDLEEKGIGTVPTLWPQALLPGDIETFCRQLDSNELVIKPVIGANGEDAFRVSAGDDPDRLKRVCDRFRDQKAMVQRFMPHILQEGEYSLFYFNGDFSHAIRKIPAASEFRSQEERGAEILAVAPDERLHQRGQLALAALETKPLYARIDFVRDGNDDYAVMEQDRIDPSLYLRMDPVAPERFAQALDCWFR